jgi:hypothetical protein
MNNSERHEPFRGFIDVSIMGIGMEHTVGRVAPVVVAVGMLLFVTPFGVVALQDDGGSVNVIQAADGSVTVSVAHDGSQVSNGSVSVSVVDANKTYQGSGTHQTTRNGTVELPAPDERINVSVTATADDWTVSTRKTLSSSDEKLAESFGSLVAAFVAELRGETTTLGPFVAEFATSNNPSPVHAGPPTQSNTSRSPGPPDHAGPPAQSNTSRSPGPPDHAGPPTQSNTSRSPGPPDHAGPSAQSNASQ